MKSTLALVVVAASAGCFLAPVDFTGKLCDSDLACGEALSCVEGACGEAELLPPVDAGAPEVDAGEPEADAGAPDAGDVCDDDVLEPNPPDAPSPLAQAQTLVLCPGDEDWFVVSVDAGARLNVALTFLHADGDLSLSLLNDQDVEIASARTSDDNEVLSIDFAVGGTFRIGVLGEAGAGNRYRIALDTTLEIDNFTADAASVPAGDLVTLSWLAVNATDCSISPGIGAVPFSGTLDVEPLAASTTYSLNCNNAVSFEERSVSVTTTCTLACSINVTAGTHDCAGAITAAAVVAGSAVFNVDLTGSDGLLLSAEVCDPTGYVIDVADSPTCDGDGGDAGSSSNDSEAQLGGATATTLAVHGNDAVAGAAILTVPDFVPSAGCTTLRWLVQDQSFIARTPAAAISSENALRLDPPADAEGTPDAIWYVALNRVVALASTRVGTGVTTANLCVR